MSTKLSRELKLLGDQIHRNKIKSGWQITTMRDWNINPASILSTLMLITTEVSEAAEAVRYDDIENFKEELADIAIRLIGLCNGMDIDLGNEILKKMETNANRSHKHGNKRI